MSDVKLKPILGVTQTERYDPDDYRDLIGDIYIEDDSIKYNGSSINLPVCDITGLLSSVKGIFKIGDLKKYIKIINLDKMMYLNKINQSTITLGIINNDLYLISGNNQFKLETPSNQSASTDWDPDTSQLPSLITRVTQLFDSVYKESDYNIHQIRDKYNVSDYIIFKDSKTKGKSVRKLVSEEFPDIQYMIDNVYTETEFDGGLTKFGVCIYEIESNDSYNITDDNYGTYIDIVINLKLHDIDYSIDKSIQLFDDTQYTEFNIDTVTDEDEGIFWEDDDIYYEDSEAEYLLMISKYGSFTTNALEAIFDKNKFVLYCTNPSITEYYISSCLIHKVNEIIGE